MASMSDFALMVELYDTSQSHASHAMERYSKRIEISNPPGFICKNKAGKTRNIQINSKSALPIFCA
jgi:hypothetical protein